MSAFPPTGLYPRFRSKIDLWLGCAILIGILVSGTVTVGLLFQEGVAALAIIPLLATSLSVWLVLGTWYGVTQTHLIVHCGPFRTAVPISNIRAIRPTRTVLSAPALSLDRLEVVHTGGALVISPADKAGFIRALKERRAAVDVAPDAPSMLGSQERLLKWALPIAPAVLLAVTAVSVLSGNSSLRVEMTPQAVVVHGSFGTTVPFADITSVSLVDTLPHLRRTMGYGGWGTMRGRAASRDLGERGHAYVTVNAPPFVVATTSQGFLVFNTDDPARTRRLFDELRAKVAR